MSDGKVKRHRELTHSWWGKIDGGQWHWYHRADGPAVVYDDGDMYWFIDSAGFSQTEYFVEILRRRCENQKA